MPSQVLGTSLAQGVRRALESRFHIEDCHGQKEQDKQKEQQGKGTEQKDQKQDKPQEGPEQAQKELDRCRMRDIQGLYRRAEFHNALIEHYFFIRQKRFLGPKSAFAWLEKKDPKTFKLIHQSLKSPSNLSLLKKAASRIYKVSLS